VVGLVFIFLHSHGVFAMADFLPSLHAFFNARLMAGLQGEVRSMQNKLPKALLPVWFAQIFSRRRRRGRKEEGKKCT